MKPSRKSPIKGLSPDAIMGIESYCFRFFPQGLSPDEMEALASKMKEHFKRSAFERVRDRRDTIKIPSPVLQEAKYETAMDVKKKRDDVSKAKLKEELDNLIFPIDLEDKPKVSAPAFKS